MENFISDQVDIAIIGAGHAGAEAAFASARLGCSTIIFTMNLDFIANLPCNPSIGGTAKGHLVREIDALGGEMGLVADETILQSRMLNRGKGPAVHSLRAQIDRRAYSENMKNRLEKQANLKIKQAEIVSFERSSDDECWVITTKMNEVYHAKALILATGTFLQARVFVGSKNYPSGPDGTLPSNELSSSLEKLGIKIKRFKTGTPARVKKSSINFTGLEPQFGDEPVVPFSFMTKEKIENKLECYITWTSEKTKEIALKNLKRSAMYSGDITGVGPRYCPSFEDKVIKFAHKERHQVFIEPCGLHTEEMYLSGLSTSMPVDVQVDMLRSVPGFENIEIMRPAYAIEYDCVDPLQLDSTLEFLDIPFLYGAGQFNGSSGYEEAAAQGLVAAINAVRKLGGQSDFRLDRSSSYIGTLIDDLVTKGCDDPYRMMTSRSEYRLILRQDNADQRLTSFGRNIGLVGDERWEDFCVRQQAKEEELLRLSSIVVAPSDKVNGILVSRETTPISTGIKLVELLKRPQIDYASLAEIDEGRTKVDPLAIEQLEVEIKYEGYIRRQLADISEMKRLENRLIPEMTQYNEIAGLRNEAKEKLSKIRPHNLGQASRISGVSPADVSVLIIFLNSKLDSDISQRGEVDSKND